MKIKSIATICKKNKQVVLFNRYSDSGTISQYIGDGSAVYPISGLPELDEESILTIFDVPEKQREDWLVRYRDIPEGISFEDTDATEKIIEQGNLSEAHCRRLRYSGHNRRRQTGRAGKRSKTAFRLVFGAEKGRIYRRAGVRAYQGITEKAAPHDGAAYPLYIIYRKGRVQNDGV